MVPASIGFGQEVITAPPPVTEVERVIVTGSNIPTAEEVGPNPVLTINRDLIEKSGERTAEELIRNTTVAGPNGVPTSNNGAGNTPGASSVSLRGFDPSDTLVLIDGRRIAPYPVGTGNGAQTFVDLNSIPRAAIDSIEILKDSASTTTAQMPSPEWSTSSSGMIIAARKQTSNTATLLIKIQANSRPH